MFRLVYFHTEGSCQDPLIFGTVVINTGCQVHLGNVHGVNNPLLIYGGHVSVLGVASGLGQQDEIGCDREWVCAQFGDGS